MDLQGLHDTFLATLGQDANARSQAEATLAAAEVEKGFVGGCLSILLADVNPSVQAAAGVFLKNRVERGWEPRASSAIKQIDPEDKQDLRQRILQAIVTVRPQLRPLLLQVIQKLVNLDYPNVWPELLQDIERMLSSNDMRVVHGGLSGLLKLCWRFRWSSISDFDKVIALTFPRVLQIGEAIISSEETQAGAMLYDITKIYKYAIARSLPQVFQEGDIMGRTVQLFVQTISKPMTPDVMRLDPQERDYHPWGKAKKWASFNLLRTHVAYVSARTKLSDRAIQLAAFAKAYSQHLIPQITSSLLQVLEHWAKGSVWLPKTALYNILRYMELTPDQKTMWHIVEPHVDGLVAHVAYKLLCATSEDVELFNDDPIEYIHKFTNVEPDTPTPDVGAASFLLALVRRRKQQTFGRIIEFIQSQVTQVDTSTLEGACHKIGILRMLEALQPVITIKNSPIIGQMESFIVQFVLPDMHNPHAILRARACTLVGAYSSLEFSRETLQSLYESTLKALYADQLPVQVAAALTLQGLSQHEDVNAAIGQHVTQIVQHLLALTKKIDLDNLLEVMDDFIKMHPEQITPFAIEMATDLRDHFMATASELADATNTMPESFDLDENDILSEKCNTALSIFQTLANLQLSLEHHRDLVLQLEQVIIPIFRVVYEQDLQEFFSEALSLHENTLYISKQVCQQEWELLPWAIQAVESCGYEILDDAYPLFESYVAYGSHYLAQNGKELETLMKLIFGVLLDEQGAPLTLTEYMLMLQLAVRILETSALREGALNPYIETLTSCALHRMIKDKEDLQKARSLTHARNIRYSVNLVSLVLAAIYNQPTLPLQFLSANNMIQPFFVLWFQTIDQFTRVDSLKLQELAILAIITLPESDLPESVKASIPELMSVLAKTVETLPAAFARLEELQKELDNDDFASALIDGGFNSGDFGNDWDDIGGDEFEDDEDTSGNAKFVAETPGPVFNAAASNPQYRDAFIPFDPDGDFEQQLDDNVYSMSPLENIEPFQVLKETLNDLSQSRPAYYQQLMSVVSEKDKGVLQDAVLRAKN